MNVFIEVTSKEDLVKTLIPLDKITYIADSPDGVVIDVMSLVESTTIGILVVESYEDIKYRISRSLGAINI